MKAEAEYRERLSRLAAGLEARGLPGAVIFSRGGATFDRFADVFYLTGFYQSWMHLPENKPLWSGRSHTALLVRADGSTVLCPSAPTLPSDTSGVDSVRHNTDWPKGVADALIEFGLAAGPIGVVGLDAISASLWREIAATVPTVKWESADDLMSDLRLRKSPFEQARIRAAAAAGRAAMEAALAAVRPGTPESAVAGEALHSLAEAGAIAYSLVVVAARPGMSRTPNPLAPWTNRVISTGDTVRIDFVMILDGYLTDFGRTVALEGADPGLHHLIATIQGAIDAVIDTVKLGVAVAALAETGDNYLEQAGVAIRPSADRTAPTVSYPPHWGHGLGLGWERPWLTAIDQHTIDAGMYLAVEKAATVNGVTVQAEQNLLVRPDGRPEVLTGPWPTTESGAP